MSKFYDISAKITNELPALKIMEDLVVTVNNRQQTILNIQAMMLEAERKQKENPEELKAEDEYKVMEKALCMLIGEDNTRKITDMNLPIDEYKAVYSSIMAVAQGEDPNAPKGE